MTRHLPDCMMPDGAEPCKGFTEIAAERGRLKAINAELLAALETCSTWFAEAPIAELEAVEQAIEKNAPVVLIHTAIAKARED